MSEQNGWARVEALVIHRLDELASRYDEIKELSHAIGTLKEDISSMRSEIKQELSSMVPRGEFETLRTDFNNYKLEAAVALTKIESKATFLGAIAGAIPVLLTLGIAAIAWIIAA